MPLGEVRLVRLVLPWCILLAAGGCTDNRFLAVHRESGAGFASRDSRPDRLVTHDAREFATRVREIGNRNQLIVWLKNEDEAPRAADSFNEVSADARLTIGVPLVRAGQGARRDIGRPLLDPSQKRLVAESARRIGAHTLRLGENLPFMTFTAPDAALEPLVRMLLRHPAVDYVEANEFRRAKPFSSSAESVTGDLIDRMLTMHRIPQAWAYTRGRGVWVGVIDSGLAGSPGYQTFHPDAQRLLDGSGVFPRGFVDDLGDPAANGSSLAFDDHGHGTEMVGLVGANANGSGAVGAMPDGVTVSMKAVFNTRRGSGLHCGFWPWSETDWCMEADDIVRAVDYACANGLRVLSMSFGASFGSSERDALSRAYHHCDILLLAATGNEPADAGTAPASYSFVMGVGGLNWHGSPIYQTQNRVVSAFSFGHTTLASCSGTDWCSPDGTGTSAGGTSAATAVAAGIAGLVRARHTSMTATEAWNRLVSTGSGPERRLDAEAALLNILPVTSALNGPQSVQPWTVHSWSVSAQGGTAPYYHEWYRDGVLVSTGSSYHADTGWSGFILEVRTEDVNGRYDGRWIRVHNDGDPSTCLNDPNDPFSPLCPS